MNSNFKLLLLIILLAFTTITTPPSSARKLALEKGGVDKQINYANKESDVKSSNVDSFDKLMGVEECGDGDGDGDGECLMRRAVIEAHLDYIYTQKRVP